MSLHKNHSQVTLSTTNKRADLIFLFLINLNIINEHVYIHILIGNVSLLSDNRKLI